MVGAAELERRGGGGGRALARGARRLARCARAARRPAQRPAQRPWRRPARRAARRLARRAGQQRRGRHGARAQRDGDGGRAPGGGRAHPRAHPLRDHAHAAAPRAPTRATRAPRAPPAPRPPRARARAIHGTRLARSHMHAHTPTRPHVTLIYLYFKNVLLFS